MKIHTPEYIKLYAQSDSSILNVIESFDLWLSQVIYFLLSKTYNSAHRHISPEVSYDRNTSEKT